MSAHDLQQTPPALEQISFFLTGGIGGLCALPIEATWRRAQQPVLAFLRSHAATAQLYRPAVRFWIFDNTRLKLQQSPAPLPVWVQGGLSGASGGVVELLAQSALRLRRPVFTELAVHPSKLFFCFGTYTFLATRFSETQPPRPFWKCWLMGATAGGVGSGIIAAVEGVRGRALWVGAVVKGALTIGTVISVQGTSCAALMRHLELG